MNWEINLGALYINQHTDKVLLRAGLPVGVDISDDHLPVAKTIFSVSAGIGQHGLAFVHERHNGKAIEELIEQVQAKSEKIWKEGMEKLNRP